MLSEVSSELVSKEVRYEECFTLYIKVLFVIRGVLDRIKYNWQDED